MSRRRHRLLRSPRSIPRGSAAIRPDGADDRRREMAPQPVRRIHGDRFELGSARPMHLHFQMRIVVDRHRHRDGRCIDPRYAPQPQACVEQNVAMMGRRSRRRFAAKIQRLVHRHAHRQRQIVVRQFAEQTADRAARAERCR